MIPSAHRPAAAASEVARAVEGALRRHGIVPAGETLLVAFSGGPDSTVLLWALTRAAARFPALRLRAAHLDHALDGASVQRAERARQLAGALGVPLELARIDVAAGARRGEGLEAAARRQRYDFLRRLAARHGARWIATGHQRDDQVETVALRLLFGSGLAGIGGMGEASGDILRPLLSVSRGAVERTLDELGVAATSDPGNADRRRPRNRLRHAVLPHLRATTGFRDEDALALAAAARGAGVTLRRRLAAHLDLRSEPAGGAAADLDLEALRRLPRPLWNAALDALRRSGGAPWGAPAAARRDLARQVAAGGAVGCDCGAGWRWHARGGRLELARATPGEVGPFSYTLRAPGVLSIPELGVTLRLTESEPAPWMFRGAPTRAAMSLPLETGQQVLIRNRRPGDRLRPLGCRHTRKLKDVLIDRRMERGRRDALPLLVVDDRIAWVPGVTIADDFRLPTSGEGRDRVWVAELVASPGRM